MYKLHSLDALVRIDAGRVIGAVGVFLAEGGSLLDVVLGGTVEFFFEDRLLVDGLELGLEVVQCLGAAVGSSSLVSKVVAGVVSFVLKRAPDLISNTQVSR